MNPEYSASTHDLHVTIFEVKCTVTNGRLLFTVCDLLTKLRGVKSDIVEMLNVGEKTGVAGVLAQVS